MFASSVRTLENPLQIHDQLGGDLRVRHACPDDEHEREGCGENRELGAPHDEGCEQTEGDQGGVADETWIARPPHERAG